MRTFRLEGYEFKGPDVFLPADQFSDELQVTFTGEVVGGSGCAFLWDGVAHLRRGGSVFLRDGRKIYWPYPSHVPKCMNWRQEVTDAWAASETAHCYTLQELPNGHWEMQRGIRVLSPISAEDDPLHLRLSVVFPEGLQSVSYAGRLLKVYAQHKFRYNFFIAEEVVRPDVMLVHFESDSLWTPKFVAGTGTYGMGMSMPLLLLRPGDAIRFAPTKVLEFSKELRVTSYVEWQLDHLRMHGLQSMHPRSLALPSQVTEEWYGKFVIAVSNVGDEAVGELVAAHDDQVVLKHWGVFPPRLRMHRPLWVELRGDSFCGSDPYDMLVTSGVLRRAPAVFLPGVVECQLMNHPSAEEVAALLAPMPVVELGYDSESSLVLAYGAPRVVEMSGRKAHAGASWFVSFEEALRHREEFLRAFDPSSPHWQQGSFAASCCGLADFTLPPELLLR